MENFDPLAPAPHPPLDTMQRIILQNLFDTQPERRKAYLAKLGFEMNPEDDNEYRPKGDKEADFSKIDPGFIDSFKAGYLKEQGKGLLHQVAGGVQGVKDEAVKDVADVGFDTAVAGPATAIGAGAGGLAGIPTGPFAIAAAIMGGAAGNAAAEGIKKMAGDVLLDKDVPLDKQGLILQSMFAGIGPQLVKGGSKLAKEGYSAFLKIRKDGIINAIKSSGGGITEDLLNKVIKSPEMFSREAVDGANGKLKNLYRGMFGIEDPLRVDAPESVRGGVFGEAMDKLNALANSETDRLGKEPAASFTVDELTQPLQDLATSINNKFKKTPEEKSALSFISKEISDLKARRGGTPGSAIPSEIIGNNGQSLATPGKEAKKLNFKEAREWLSAIQKEVSAKDTAGNYLHEAGGTLAPAFSGQNGALKVINEKAASVGSDLPSINMQRHRVLSAYNSASENLTMPKITSAFVGNDSPMKDSIRDVAGEVDNILGEVLGKSPGLSQQIEDGSMQRIVEGMYKNPGKSFGSGPVNAQIVQGAMKGAAKGAVAGVTAGAVTAPVTHFAGPAVGGAVGAVGGAALGAERAAMMSTPENAINALRKSTIQSEAAQAAAQAPAHISPAATLLAQEAGRTLAPNGKPDEVDLNKSSSSVDDFDPLQDFDPLKDFPGK